MSAQDIQPYQAQDIQEYKAQEVKSKKADEVQEYKAQDIKQDKSQDIKEYKAQEVKSNKVRTIQGPRAKVNSANSQSQAQNENKTEAQQTTENNQSLDSYFGLYQYWVPGTSYTVPDYTNRQLVIHNSSGTGVLPGGISIQKDGKFVWNSSWDGKVIKGSWSKTNDSGYPIELNHAQENKNWRVGKAPDASADIVIWDGSTWYYGKKIK